ncbi:MAG: SRPBCC domain-containing protein [Gemmatimonadaceae bacterium]
MIAQRLSDPALDRLFRALADSTRRDIVARLLSGQSASVSALASRYKMSFAAVQKHVAALEEAAEWPATFTRHDVAVGGESHYVMKGPDGAQSRGWFTFFAGEPLKRLEMQDGFADDTGKPNPKLPTIRMVFEFEATTKGSRFKSTTFFPDIEAMETVLKMGMEEGLKSAMGQIDAVLADLASFAAGRARPRRQQRKVANAGFGQAGRRGAAHSFPAKEVSSARA